MVDTKMVKTVGEHWVCSALARYGWAPALTRDGIERTDILAVATHLENRPTVEIQVKTATQRGKGASWPLGLNAQINARSDENGSRSCSCRRFRPHHGPSSCPATTSLRRPGSSIRNGRPIRMCRRERGMRPESGEDRLDGLAGLRGPLGSARPTDESGSSTPASLDPRLGST
jgi:hypothetical protein